MSKTHYNLKRKKIIKLVIFKVLPSVITSPKDEIRELTDEQKNGPRRKTLDGLTKAITCLFE